MTGVETAALYEVLDLFGTLLIIGAGFWLIVRIKRLAIVFLFAAVIAIAVSQLG